MNFLQLEFAREAELNQLINSEDPDRFCSIIEEVSSRTFVGCCLYYLSYFSRTTREIYHSLLKRQFKLADAQKTLVAKIRQEAARNLHLLFGEPTKGEQCEDCDRLIQTYGGCEKIFDGRWTEYNQPLWGLYHEKNDEEVESFDLGEKCLPTSSVTIFKQSQLFKASRYLPRLPIRRFNHDDGTYHRCALFTVGNVAFFKTAQSPGVVIEEIVWDVAQIFGLEESFTSVKRREFEKEKGTLQLAVDGITLNDFIEYPSDDYSPLKTEIVTAMIATLMLGLSDSHTKNLILTKKGQILHIDVIKSFTHSNDFILINDFVVSSFKSGLLAFPECFEKFDQHLFREELSRYAEGRDAFVKYLRSPFCEKKTKDLPKEWWDVDNIIAAFDERLERFETALKATTLFELCCAIHPKFKLTAALTLSGANPVTEAERYYNSVLKGYMDVITKDPTYIPELLKEAILVVGNWSMKRHLDAGYIDPLKVENWCHDYSLPEVIGKIANEIVWQKNEQYIENGEEVLKRLRVGAKKDNKDCFEVSM